MENLSLSVIIANGANFVWVLIIVLFIVSFLGIVIPVIPGVLLLWLGFIAYHFLIDGTELTLVFWVTMSLFTFVLLGADFYLNVYFVDQFGGSAWSKWGALIGMFAGLFIYPPLGMILVPLLLVFVIEFTIQKSFKKGLFASVGTLAGFLSSAITKVFLHVVMIIMFFMFIIF